MNKKPDKQSNDAYPALLTVVNSLDALIYVADMDSYELLFVNEYGRQKWGDPGKLRCWEYLQKNQSGPCTFCTNKHLRNDEAKPTGVYVWEFRNTVTNRWFQCRDEAINWPDGRLVRIEIATDITERKQMESELDAARREAEFLAGIDPLTSLNNRRAFSDLGNQLLKESIRFKQPASLIMFDLDHFKQINDQFGHESGDEVLLHIARLTRETVRQADIVARIGGEEFAILLPQTDLEQAGQLAERLRQTLMNNTVNIKGQGITTTASFGVISCDPECDELRLDQMLADADAELYKAKNAGRNRSFCR